MSEKQIKRENKSVTLDHRYRRPFKKCVLDIVGPLTSNYGNKYILTFQDNLTKFSKAIFISNQEAAETA